MFITENGLCYTVLYLAANALRIYAVYRFICIFFARKDVNKFVEGLMFSIYFLINSFGFIVFRSLAVNVVTNIVSCFLITCLYPGSHLVRLFFTGLVYGLNIGWDGLIGAAFFPTKNYFLTSGAFTSVCVLVTEIVFERIHGVKHGIGSSLAGKWRLLLMIPGISIILAVLNYTLGFGTITAVINLLGLLVIDFSVFHIYAHLIKEQKERYERQIMEEQDRLYMHQSALMEQSVTSLRHFRHDIRMHWNALSVMVKEGRNKDALDYLEEISGVVSPKWEVSATGNRDLDCILNYEYSKAIEAGIRIHYSIAVPSIPLIKAYDLNIILTNLLDNAIEAVAQCSKKEISVSIRYIGGLLTISVENPYSGTIHEEEGRILSSKGDDGLHGFGLENIRMTARKYDGEAIFEYRDGTFTATVDLFVPI